jgi:hypothetical protein
MRRTAQERVKVADEVWIAAALLHREHPERIDFAVDEIVERARKDGLTPTLRGSVHVHVIQHCVANRRPNPGRYRMLLETGRGRRRLFRPGDPYDPAREGAKSVPHEEEVPSSYRGLLDWYRTVYLRQRPEQHPLELLLALAGSGRELWADEPADEYVRRLREGWE